MFLTTELCVHTFQISSSLLLSSSNNNYNYNNIKPTFNKLYYCYPFSNKLLTLSFTNINNKRSCIKSPVIACKSHSYFDSNNYNKSHNDDGDEYVEASLLVSETVRHHHLRKQGFREAKEFVGHLVPSSARVKDIRSNVNSIGLSILRRYRNPTIFLKISCEGDFLLPIVVGEFAVEKLINSLNEDHGDGDYPKEFQLLRNLVAGLGNEVAKRPIYYGIEVGYVCKSIADDSMVRLVKITNRVANTYYARIYFGKLDKMENISVDARPSDAINVAQRCKAPIYVNKQIFLTDAIQFSYGTGRVRDTKPIYDVLLDSPMDGPDILVEEFNLVQRMNLAIEEERYYDAAMWRDKLNKLINSATEASQQTNWNEATTPGLL